MTLAELARKAERLAKERVGQIKSMASQASSSGSALNSIPGNLRSLRDTMSSLADDGGYTRTPKQWVSDNLASNGRELKRAAKRAVDKVGEKLR